VSVSADHNLQTHLEDTERLLRIAMDVVTYLSDRLEQLRADQAELDARLTKLLATLEETCSFA